MHTPETYSYTLPSGAIIEVQNLPGRGAREVASDSEKISLSRVVEPLGEVVQVVLEQIRSAVKTADEVKVELGASLKGKSTLVLVSGETEATIKVILTWQRSKGYQSTD